MSKKTAISKKRKKETFDNLFEKIKTNRGYKKKINSLPLDGLKVDLNNFILHPIYQVLWKIDARYKFIFGSKDNGKSKQSAFYVLTRWLSNEKRNVAVVRKYANLNSNSTLADIIWVMNKLADDLNLSQLKPVNAEEYRRNGRRNLFYYTKTAPIEMVNSVTGQKILFTGLDRLASGGLSLNDSTHAFDTIWAEELVDIEEEGKIDIMDDSTFQKWRVIESTVFRGTRQAILDDQGNEIGQERRKGLEWVDESIIFSYNSHNPDHWLLREIGDKYVPLDPKDEEDCQMMKESVIRTYYDKNYQGGEGIFVMRTSVYLNGGRDANLVEQMRKDDPMSYAYLYLGATKAIGGLAYSGYDKNLIIKDIDKKEIFPISIGIDHANSKDHGDDFIAAFLATDKIVEGNLGQGWAVPGYNYEYVFDEYVWNNKNMEFKTDEDMARDVINKLIEHVESDEDWRSFLTRNKFSIVVDNSAGSFMQILRKVIFDIASKKMFLADWMQNLVVCPVEGKNVSIMIDGVKTKARKARVERNKRKLGLGMIIFNPVVRGIRKSFLSTSYDVKGEVIDKDRDGTDAYDYATMVEPHYSLFNTSMMYKEFKRKKIEY